MALFDRNDYDREFGNRGMYDRGWSAGGGRNRDFGGTGMRGDYLTTYDREYRGGGGNSSWDRGVRGNMYGRDYGARDRNTWGGYDRGYGARDRDDENWVGRGYDVEYKTRQQTDTGDPFGDRQSNTPIRMIRGEYHAYDDGYRGSRAGYDQSYRGGGAYDQAYRQQQTRYDRGFTGRGIDRTGYNRGYMGRETGINNEPYYGDMNRGNRDRGGYRGYGNDRDWF